MFATTEIALVLALVASPDCTSIERSTHELISQDYWKLPDTLKVASPVVKPGDLLPCIEMLVSDFDGNGYEDVVVTLAPTRTDTYVYAVFRFETEARASLIEIVRGRHQRPMLSLLAPGRYQNVGGPSEQREPGEKGAIDATLPGFSLNSPATGHRAYFLGQHRWVYVRLSPA